MSENSRTPSKTARVRDAVRVFNKHVLNPAMLRLAGRRHWYASVIRHKGRRSGKAYATPVVADRVADGFVVPLPYGTRVDWLRNVQADGHATIRSDGSEYELVDPEILDAPTALPLVPARHRRSFERMRIENFLRLRDAAVAR